MTNHLKVYLSFFNLSYEEFIPCLLCNKRACEIHHITPKSQIFNENRDDIKNLAALCHECHFMIHNIKSPREFKDILLEKQKKLIDSHKV